MLKFCKCGAVLVVIGDVGNLCMVGAARFNNIRYIRRCLPFQRHIVEEEHAFNNLTIRVHIILPFVSARFTAEDGFSAAVYAAILLQRMLYLS